MRPGFCFLAILYREKGAGNDVRRYGGVSNWKGLPENVSISL